MTTQGINAEDTNTTASATALDCTRCGSCGDHEVLDCIRQLRAQRDSALRRVRALLALDEQRVAQLLHESVWSVWITNLIECGAVKPDAAGMILPLTRTPFVELHPYGRARAVAFARRLLDDPATPIPRYEQWARESVNA